MPTIRNTDGFSTVNAGERNSGYMLPYPVPYTTMWEDFIAAASAVPPGWTHTQTNGTLALASGTYLTQTLGGADNDLSHLYPTTATMAIAAGKKAHFRWRGKVDKGSGGTIGQEEVYIGLSAVATGTSFVAAGGASLAMDDFIGFASFDATTNIGAITRKTDVESVESAAAVYADATFLDLSWDFDGTTVTFFKDAGRIAQITTNIPTAAMVPVLQIKAGGAHAKVLTTDFIFCAIER